MNETPTDGTELGEFINQIAKWMFVNKNRFKHDYADILSEVGLQFCLLSKKNVLTGDRKKDFNILIQATAWRLVDEIRARQGRSHYRIPLSFEAFYEKWAEDDHDTFQSLKYESQFDFNLTICDIARVMDKRILGLLQGKSRVQVSKEACISEARVAQLFSAGMKRAGYRFTGGIAGRWVEV